MKHIFGLVETLFNIFYLLTVAIISIIFFVRPVASPLTLIAALMALILVLGDSFHLVPRIIAQTRDKKTKRLQIALGRGKQTTSVTMTIFYLLLWHYGLLVTSHNVHIISTVLVYFLGLLRIVLCLMPQNRWTDSTPSYKWGVLRNIPFTLQGLLVTWLFFYLRGSFAQAGTVSLMILLSFAFYLPVVLWAQKNPKIGMLMLPKSLSYIFILALLL